jgi:hypothetical protein
MAKASVVGGSVAVEAMAVGWRARATLEVSVVWVTVREVGVMARVVVARARVERKVALVATRTRPT